MRFKFLFSFLLFLLSLFFARGVLAAPNIQGFCFEAHNYILNSDDGIEVRVFSDGPIEDSFLVKPVCSEGECSVFDEFNNVWVDGSEDWNLMTKLFETTKIKVEMNSDKLPLYFLLKNEKTGEVHRTCIKNVWSYRNYDSYLQKLNSNILKENEVSSSSTVLQNFDEQEDSQNLQRSVKIFGPSLNKKSFLVCMITFFVSFLLGLFLPKRKSIPLD